MIKGSKHKLETIKKISLLMIGRKRPENVKEKIRLTLTGRKHNQKWKDNIKKNHSHYWLGKKQSKQSNLKRSKSLKGIPKSKEHNNKVGIANKIALKGNKIWLGKHHTENSKNKNREWHISNPNRIYKNTGIELKVENELKRRDIDYKKQIPLCKISIVDFYLPKYNIVIQCDGCWYHGCPIHNPKWNINKKRDKNQDKILKENGFNVYRFWEHEINKNIEKCIEQVMLDTINSERYSKIIL